MPFDEKQIAELNKPLDRAHVKPPAPGKYGDYIEGWRAIEIANRIFGFDGWSCEVTRLEMTNSGVFDLSGKNGAYQQFRCGYLCSVSVTAGGVTRSGVGHGTGAGKPEAEGDHHDSAAKEAETDAMKRALRCFGHPLGLALYDKTQANVGDPNAAAKVAGEKLKTAMDAITDVAGCDIDAFAKAHADEWALMEDPQRKFFTGRMEKLRGSLAQAPSKDLEDIPF